MQLTKQQQEVDKEREVDTTPVDEQESSTQQSPEPIANQSEEQNPSDI